MGRLLVKFPSRNICEENPMTATLNGNVRKSLAEQIDRLDGILDGLADSLSGAIARDLSETPISEVAMTVFGATDVYMQFSVMRGMLKMWHVLRFPSAPRVIRPGYEVHEGVFQRGGHALNLCRWRRRCRAGIWFPGSAPCAFAWR